MNLYGMTVVESSLLTVKRVETRVRGGYMNRWWIRAYIEKPCFVIDSVNSRVYVHPKLMQSLRGYCREGV